MKIIVKLFGGGFFLDYKMDVIYDFERSIVEVFIVLIVDNNV